MNFAEYLNTLYPFFDWEPLIENNRKEDAAFIEEDAKEEKIFKSSRKSKATFTKALLISGLKKDAGCREKFKKWSKDYYLKLFRGDEGRSASSALSRINFETDFDDFAFRDFITEYFEKRFGEIRKAFAEKNIQIEQDDEPEALLDLFKKICAVTSEKTNLKITILGEDQRQIADIILRLRQVLNGLKEEAALMDLSGINLDNYLIIRQLKEKTQADGAVDAKQETKEPSIIDRVFGYTREEVTSSCKSSEPFEHEDIINPIREKISELHKINHELVPYMERYPSYKHLRVLYYASAAINHVNLFLRDPKWPKSQLYHPDIEQYEKLLTECSRNIVKPTTALPEIE